MKREAKEEIQKCSEVKYVIAQKRWRLKAKKGYIDPSTLTLVWGLDNDGFKRVSVVKGYSWKYAESDANYSAVNLYSQRFDCSSDAERRYDRLKLVIEEARRLPD